MPEKMKTYTLNRYLQDFKHSHTRCDCCHRLLERVTLIHNQRIISKKLVLDLNTRLTEEEWRKMSPQWQALCRFCADLHYKDPSAPCLYQYFDIIGFWHYLLDCSELTDSSVHEYVVRLRRLNQLLITHLSVPSSANLAERQLTLKQIEDYIQHWLPAAQGKNYIIAINKYRDYLSNKSTSNSVWKNGQPPKGNIVLLAEEDRV